MLQKGRIRGRDRVPVDQPSERHPHGVGPSSPVNGRGTKVSMSAVSFIRVSGENRQNRHLGNAGFDKTGKI